MSKQSYISPYKNYRSAEQAETVLALLGYKKTTDSMGRVVARVWFSETVRPARIRLEVGGQYPHRVVVRKESEE